MRSSFAGIWKSLFPGKKPSSQVNPSVEFSVVDPDPGRIHPLLPTVKYARDHPDEVYSDHLPRGGEWKPVSTAPPLQFRSWNIMGSGASGFDRESLCDFIKDEEKDQQEARFKRIATTVSKWTTGKDKDRVDFIALQEVSNPKLILNELGLLEKKDADWGYTYVQKTHTLTLYRKSVLELETSHDDKEKANFHYKFVLQDAADTMDKYYKVPIQIHNTYLDHRNFPGEYHRESVKKKFSDDKPSIMLGDFNCRFAPTPKSPPSLFTVVTSKFFRSPQRQGGDHVDAALVRDDKGISQLETWVIDPKTGKKYEAPPPTAESVSSADKDLEAERKRYSPVMEESWMQPALEKARQCVEDKHGISVFMAFNNEKDPKMAFQFKDGFLYAIYKALSSKDQVTYCDYPPGSEGKTYPRKANESCVFIDYTRSDLQKFQTSVASAYSQMNTIMKMFPPETGFSITASTPAPGQSRTLTLQIKPPGQAVISIPVDKDIMQNLSSRTNTDTSGSTLQSPHL